MLKNEAGVTRRKSLGNRKKLLSVGGKRGTRLERSKEDCRPTEMTIWKGCDRDARVDENWPFPI